MKEYRYDIAVIGGGPAGVCAALAAARSGANVLIIEQYGVLGGMSTMGQVAPWMTFHDMNGVQVVRGIAQEIVDRLSERGMCRGHVRDTMGETWSVTPFDNEGLKLVLAEMCCEAGVSLLFHTFVFGVETEGGRISALKAANKDGEVRICAKVFIDASGDGDIFAMSGCSMEKGREGDHLMQPCTTNFSMYNVDFAKIRDFMLAHPEDFHDKTDMTAMREEGALPDCVSGFFEEWKRGQEELDMHILRERILFFRGIRDDIATINTTRLTQVDCTDADSMSNAEVELRKQVYQVAELLKKYVPGFEKAEILGVAPVVGIREGRRLVGRYVLTGDDLRAARRFPDDIAVYGYPIDQHHPDGAGFTQSTVAAYGIPYRTLLPKEIDNLLVAGRCISCDREAQSSLRTTPGVMAIGEAAGAAAAEAVKEDIPLDQVDVKALQALLRSRGAYLD
ncbi:MAG: FAD-dependent oxidoreductase [Lachnospiraceae bacterium]|nr:FAD-dependent oxidoreductase [Lachnospiraceae bacterium]